MCRVTDSRNFLLKLLLRLGVSLSFLRQSSCELEHSMLYIARSVDQDDAKLMKN
jgi:hypothetical protein